MIVAVRMGARLQEGQRQQTRLLASNCPPPSEEITLDAVSIVLVERQRSGSAVADGSRAPILYRYR
jgi:hypothetical protein